MRLRLHELREQHSHKPTQAQMAELMGKPFTSYRNMERQHNNTISYKDMEWLCNYFKCQPSDLFYPIEYTSTSVQKEAIQEETLSPKELTELAL